MPRNYTGLTRNAPLHFQLDAGAYYKNYDLTQEFNAQQDKLIGATAGGGSFSAVPTVRQIEVDGKKGAVEGFDALDDWAVTMTCTVKELTYDNMADALGMAKVEEVTTPAGGYRKITGKGEVEADDYHDNITWIGRLSGSLKPIIIQIYKALCTSGLALSPADKSEGTVPMTMRGSYSLDDMETPPFAIFYPPVP